MAVTGTMESRSTVGEQDVTSQVSRAGATVHTTLVNARGDVVRSSMTDDGRVVVRVERDGRVVGGYEGGAR